MDYIGYCVRVDALEGYADKLPMLQSHTDFESIVAVRHKGATKENPHYHLVIKTNIKDQAFRVRLRKIFDQGKGNGHMSIKPWDGKREAISYLFHEDPDAVLVVQYNISDETIAQARILNREITQMVLDAKTKAAWRAEEIVYDEIEQARSSSPFANRSWPAAAGKLTDTMIGARLLLTCLRTGKYTPQPWLIRAMTERIQFKLLNGEPEPEEEFALRLSRQIFWKDT